MSRLVPVLIAIILAVGALQWGVPRLAASLVARQLARVDHGPKPAVAIEAVPFWELFSGHFSDVTVTARNADLKSLTIRRIHLTWTNGQVSLSSLKSGQVSVARPGRLTMTAVITGPALSQFLAKEGSISHPEVVIKPSGVALKGQIALGGAEVPLDTQGSLVESSNHQALVFHPTSIDGLNLPVLTDVQLFNLTRLKMPVHLSIHKVQLESNQLVLTVGN